MAEAKNIGHLGISRRPGESVIIFDGKEKIKITISGVEGNRVRLVFESDPAHFNVSREEAFSVERAKLNMVSR